MKKIGQKVEKNFRQQHGFGANSHTSETRRRKQEKEKIIYDKKQPSRKKTHKDVGEYIDYEEID